MFQVLPQAAASPFENLLQNFISSGIQANEMKAQEQKARQMAQDQQKQLSQTLGGLSEQSSPLDMIRALSSLPIGAEEKKAYLNALTLPLKLESQKKGPQEITPYQKELIKHRSLESELKNQKNEYLRKKAESKLPGEIASYTKNYLEDYEPEDRILVNNYVKQAYEEGNDLDEALQVALDTLQMRDEYLKNLNIPSPGWFTSSASKNEMTEEAANNLMNAAQSGLLTRKKAKATLTDLGWSEEDAIKILQNAGFGSEVKPKKREVKQSAADLLKEAKGDKDLAMKLFMERNR